MTKRLNEVSHVFLFSHCGVLYIVCWPKILSYLKGS